MRAVHALPLATLLAACTPDPGDSARDTSPPAFEPLVQITTAADGWLRGDLHMHSEHSDGWDTVATVIDIAEYLEHPTFLAHHPEYQGSGLDFIAMTDHRTVAQNSDPDFVSDRLVLIPSEEFGSPGHANLPGVLEFVDHDPDDDGVTVEDIQGAIAEAHAQGALFSPNHPFTPHIPFPWDVTGFDTIEIWNSGWILASPPMSVAELDAWEASRGTASPIFRRGLQTQGRGASGQALTWYEALLSRGRHVGLVGGSDRHAVLMNGFPTTYVQAASADVNGVVDGMRQRHSYVTRTPASAQLLGVISVDGEDHQWGDQIPVPAAGAEVTVTLRVARAEGGRARLVWGPHVASDEALEEATLGSPVAEATIDSQDFVLEHRFTAVPGDWIYPIVHEPLFAPGITEEQQDMVLEVAVLAAEAGADAMNVAQAVAPLVDIELMANPEDCDPDDWEASALQCILADQEGLATFFVPDMLDRAMNAWMEDGVATEWTMGAVASAVLFVEE
jgi:hypothetical protein